MTVQDSLFISQSGSKAVAHIATRRSLCYILSYARMDARKNETTSQAWTERFGVHRKDWPGNTRESAGSTAPFLRSCSRRGIYTGGWQRNPGATNTNRNRGC